MAVLEKLTTNINLEMSGDTKRYLVSAKQGDKATRYIVARLLNNGEPYTIPTDARAVINEKKPDGKHVYNACTFSGEYVTVELTNQMLASAGVAYCDIEIRSADNTQVITSASFEMEIEKTQRNESAILSSNEFTELERREQEIAEIEKSVVDAENERKEAEKKREEAEKERGRELSKHNVSGDAHNDIRIKITELANKVYAFLDTDDVTLDQASEFISYMKSNRSLIESVTNSKVNVTDIIDNLTTNVANKPLSAARGVELKSLYDDLKNLVDGIKEKLTEDIVSITYDADTKTLNISSGRGGVTASTIAEIAEAYEVEKIVLNGVELNLTSGVSESQLEDVVKSKIEDEKGTVVQLLIDELQGLPVFGVVDEDNTITVTSMLSAGTYSLCYENEDESLVGIGSLVVQGENAFGYTNQIPLSIDADGEIYNGTGYKKSARIRSTGDITDISGGSSPAFVTGYIPVKNGDVIRLKNCWADPDGTEEVYGQSSYALNFLWGSLTTVNLITAWYYLATQGHMSDVVYDSSGNIVQFTNTYPVDGYIRLVLGGDAEKAIVTINEEIE